MYILLLLSLLLSALLLYRTISLGKGVGRLSDTLKEIRRNGFRRRIHLGFSHQPMMRLGTELNALIDECQRILEEKQSLELSHKQLISNISHDIRTPLTSLLGYVEVMKEQVLLPEEQREYLEIVYSKAWSMNRMIEEFFDLAKLESKDTGMELARVDLTEIIREALVSFYQDFMTAKVIPEIELPEKSVFVRGNRAAIERILDNLISNVLKYGSGGGMIRIGIREDADKVWIDVLDKGQGIPESQLPFVFDRLYVAEASRNSSSRGTGLGLAIARQLVMMQNGDITVTSTPGERTVFSFYLIKD